MTNTISLARARYIALATVFSFLCVYQSVAVLGSANMTVADLLGMRL